MPNAQGKRRQETSEKGRALDMYLAMEKVCPPAASGAPPSLSSTSVQHQDESRPRSSTRPSRRDCMAMALWFGGVSGREEGEAQHQNESRPRSSTRP